jgi:hypothetical protein
VIVPVAAAVTEVVEMAKVAVVLPAATVTEFGTVADAPVIETATTAPPEGAAALRVIVPAETLPPSTLVGLIVTEARTAAGGMVKVVPLLTPLKVAEISADAFVLGAEVIITNVALVLPAGITTPPGTVASALSLDSATKAPSAGAGSVRVTVPIAVPPPTTLDGDTDSERGVTPSAAFSVNMRDEFAARVA